jgi:hypothetical protein
MYVARLLGVEVSDSQEKLISNILEFLLKPKVVIDTPSINSAEQVIEKLNSDLKNDSIGSSEMRVKTRDSPKKSNEAPSRIDQDEDVIFICESNRPGSSETPTKPKKVEFDAFQSKSLLDLIEYFFSRWAICGQQLGK